MSAVLARPAIGAASAKPSIDDLDAAIRRISSSINTAQYELLMLVREFDDRLGWAKWSFNNCAEWLAWRCGLSLSAAREKVRTAQALRGLPRISTAFEEGRISYSKVRALTRAAHARNEEPLLAYALDATASQVEERCRQTTNVHPDSVHEARRAWERRSLSVWRNRDRGTMTISVEVPVEAGELITAALDRAVEAGAPATGPEFPEASWQTQQADALVAIATAYLAGGAGESAEDGSVPAGRSAAADHYQMVIHVDEAALRGGISVDNSAAEGGAARADGTARADLPIDTIKRLACDGSVVTVTENARGVPLDVGRKQRTVPTALKRALWSRDRGCAFPGCHNTRFVDAHHIHHWSEGGATSLENLTLLCSHHHRLVHEGGYRIKRDRDGEIYFQRADGRSIPRCGYQADVEEPSAEVRDDHTNTLNNTTK